jgi:hypothetical protein
LISEHSNGIVPEIPGELLVKMFIHKAEEEALGINQNATKRYRSNNQITDSDEFAIGKRKADQRQYPPIYLISMIHIAPDM